MSKYKSFPESEVSWEQKGKYEKVPKYEAEVCFGTAGLEALDEETPNILGFSLQIHLEDVFLTWISWNVQDWQPVRGLYVQQMEEDEGEAGGLRSVTAPWKH